MSKKCSFCSVGSETFVCCKGVYYCHYKCQLNDTKHHPVCKKRKEIFNHDDHIIINAVYRFFVENITSILIELNRVLNDINNNNTSPYIYVRFEEGGLNALNATINPSNVEMKNMSDCPEFSEIFEKGKFDFLENVLFHFKSSKANFLFFYPYKKIHGSKYNEQIPIINQSPYMMNLEFLLGSVLYTIISSTECWKFSGFVKKYVKPDMSLLK